MPNGTFLPGSIKTSDQLDDDDAERERVGLVTHPPEHHVLWNNG